MGRLIENCDERIRPLVVVSLNTGFRRGELLGLTWDRVDFERGILTLLKTKSGKRRDAPMNRTVRETLEKIGGREGHVFRRRNGEPFKDSTVRKPFQKALKKSGIEDFRWHDMRHCFASSLVMAGVDLNVVRELLGQADLKMTLRYSHLSPTAKTRAVNVLDDMMAQKPPQKAEAKNVVSLRP
jgi:integrase